MFFSSPSIFSQHFFVYSLFFSSSDTEEKNTELGVPENRNQVEDYETKLNAYSRSNEERTNNVSLEFDINDFKTKKTLSEEEKRKILEKEVDSALNQNKITYNKPANTSTNKRSYSNVNAPKKRNNTNTSTKTEKPVEDISKSVNDFFN